MFKKREVSSSALEGIAKKMRVERPTVDPVLAEKCIRNIRVLAADIVQKANSGHPGAPMGCAPMAHLLWGEFMNFNANVPKWADRDRFILSNGHACALLYRLPIPSLL
jgi:transketolase